jgi:Transcriptional Coactivator p15 (PC4)
MRRNWGQRKNAPEAPVALPIVVAEWPRNEREVVRITLSRYKGHTSIDIRVWFRAEEGDFRASRRGISVRLAEISGVRKGLRKAHEIAVELGLIEQENRFVGRANKER